MEKSTIYVGNKPFHCNLIKLGNLTPDATEETIRAAFIPFGEIKSVEIPIDHQTGLNIFDKIA